MFNKFENRKRNRRGKQERLAFRIEAMDLVVDSVQTCNVFSSDHSLPITLVLIYQPIPCPHCTNNLQHFNNFLVLPKAAGCRQTRL